MDKVIMVDITLDIMALDLSILMDLVLILDMDMALGITTWVEDLVLTEVLMEAPEDLVLIMEALVLITPCVTVVLITLASNPIGIVTGMVLGLSHGLNLGVLSNLANSNRCILPSKRISLNRPCLNPPLPPLPLPLRIAMDGSVVVARSAMRRASCACTTWPSFWRSCPLSSTTASPRSVASWDPSVLLAVLL